jgi:hypothetical protein
MPRTKGAKSGEGKKLLEQSKVLTLPPKVNTASAGVAMLVAGALALAASHAEARTYRWVDESGTVVYSQVPPPPGVDVQTVRPPPPPAEPEAATQDLQERLQRLEDAREDRELARVKAAEEERQAQQVAKGCAAAEQNLRVYRDSPPNRLIRDASGEYRRVTPDERAAKVREAEAYLDKHCR